MLLCCLLATASASGGVKKKAKVAPAKVDTAGGDAILAGHTKVLASGCPAGLDTKLRRFQLTVTDMNSPVSIGWSVNSTPLAASTTGFVSAPVMSTFYTAGSDRRIVFTVRCVDDKKMCGANIKAEFECANFLSAGSKKVQIVGFGGVAQVRDGVDKQVQIFKTVASKPSFLAQQETVVDQTSSTVIDRLKTKISNMPPSSSLVQLQETAAARVPACVVGKDDLRCGMGFPVAKVNGKTFCCGDQRNSAPFIAMINADVSATCPAGTVCKARPVANMACQLGVNDANCAKGMVTHAKYCCPAGATMSFEHTLLDDTQLVTCSIPSNCATKSKARTKRTSRKVPKRA